MLRAHFAAFPRTDIVFGAAAAATNASLLVYYLGVPDPRPSSLRRTGLGLSCRHPRCKV
jgi:hypothetical protein